MSTFRRFALPTLLLGALALSASAQQRTIIRGIPYEDHSASTRLTNTTAAPGATFSISSRSLRFSARQSVRVVLQDRARRGGAGVTAFALRNVRYRGSTLLGQAPAHASFVGRSFAVTVFVYERGQPNRYAAAGTLRIQRAVIRTPRPRTPIRAPIRTPRRPVTTPPRRPAPPRLPTTVIRGISYEDHSRSTRLVTGAVTAGGQLRITSSTLRFRRGQQIRVVLSDTARRGGAGVTAFALRNVRFLGGTLIGQAPAHNSFRGRTFHVTVFLYERGQRNRYASAGRLSIR